MNVQAFRHACAACGLPSETATTLEMYYNQYVVKLHKEAPRRGRPPLALNAKALLDPLSEEIRSIKSVLDRNVDAETAQFYSKYVDFLSTLREIIRNQFHARPALTLGEAIEERHAHGLPAGLHWSDWVDDATKAKIMDRWHAYKAGGNARTRGRARRPFTDSFTRPRNQMRWDDFMQRIATIQQGIEVEASSGTNPDFETPHAKQVVAELCAMLGEIRARAARRRAGDPAIAKFMQAQPNAPVSMHSLLTVDERQRFDWLQAQLAVIRGLVKSNETTNEGESDATDAD